MRLEHTYEGFLVLLAKHYTIRGAPMNTTVTSCSFEELCSLLLRPLPRLHRRKMFESPKSRDILQHKMGDTFGVQLQFGDLVSVC